MILPLALINSVPSDPDATAMMQLLLGLNLLLTLATPLVLFVVWLMNRGKADSQEIVNNPLTVALEENFVSKSDFEKLETVVERNRLTAHSELLRLGGKIDSVKDTLMEAGETREENIFRRINETTQNLQGQITALPGELVILLRNTGVIKS